MEDHQHTSSQTVAAAIVFALLLLAGAYFLPWKNVNWGNLNIKPAETVTVTGEAKSQVRSQIATFSAGVNAINDNKDVAITEVNQKINAIIVALKNFGITDQDFKTQNLSVYQQQENYYDQSGVQKLRPGQWNVNNTLDITLRNIDQASALADLLTTSGATNVYGPNFTVDNTSSAQNELLSDAMKDALTKAEIIAKASGKKVGNVVSVTEGTSAVGFFPMSAKADSLGGGGAPVEPGSQTVQKSVTVVYELK